MTPTPLGKAMAVIPSEQAQAASNKDDYACDYNNISIRLILLISKSNIGHVP
jgi:hypothetical protein